MHWPARCHPPGALAELGIRAVTQPALERLANIYATLMSIYASSRRLLAGFISSSPRSINLTVRWPLAVGRMHKQAAKRRKIVPLSPARSTKMMILIGARWLGMASESFAPRQPNPGLGSEPKSAQTPGRCTDMTARGFDSWMNRDCKVRRSIRPGSTGASV